MSRVMEKHRIIHTINEMHFFEEKISMTKKIETHSLPKARQLFSWLLCIPKEGYLKYGSPEEYKMRLLINIE